MVKTRANYHNPEENDADLNFLCILHRKECENTFISFTSQFGKNLLGYSDI